MIIIRCPKTDAEAPFEVLCLVRNAEVQHVPL
jgi:hypothetical protein